MPPLIAIVVGICLLGTLVTLLAANDAADGFFDALTRQHPELAGAFPLPGMFTRYGPIRPSYMQYLHARLYLQLSDPVLQRAGARARRLVNLYAVLFTALIVSAIGWKVQSGA